MLKYVTPESETSYFSQLYVRYMCETLFNRCFLQQVCDGSG